MTRQSPSVLTALLVITLALTPGAVNAEDAEEAVVRILSEPPGARVSIDGKPFCPSTPCSRVIAVGEHEIMLDKGRYELLTERRVLGRGRSKFVLVPLFGRVRVSTWPEGLRFIVGDGEVQRSPRTVDVEPGQISIHLRDPCHAPEDRDLEAPPGSLQLVHMEPPQQRQRLHIDARDAQGTLAPLSAVLDGVPLGELPLDVDVPVCAKHLELRSLGGIAWEGPIGQEDLAAGELIVQLPVPPRDPSAEPGYERADRPPVGGAPPTDLEEARRRAFLEAVPPEDHNFVPIWTALRELYYSEHNYPRFCVAADRITRQAQAAWHPLHNLALARCRAITGDTDASWLAARRALSQRELLVQLGGAEALEQALLIQAEGLSMRASRLIEDTLGTEATRAAGRDAALAAWVEVQGQSKISGNEELQSRCRWEIERFSALETGGAAPQ